MSQPAITLRSLAPSIFLPVLVYEIGNGAIAPIIALTALGLGASTATAGLILTVLGVGQILGNLPSSFLVNRVGDRRAMIVAAGVAALALLGCFFAPNLLVFAGAVAVIGLCNATYYLGRQHYMIETVPAGMRAVALSNWAVPIGSACSSARSPGRPRSISSRRGRRSWSPSWPPGPPRPPCS